MPELWVVLPVIVSAAVILLLYTIPPPWVKRYMSAFDRLDLEAMTAPEALGATLRHAYPPEDVAGMSIAIIESQRPAIKQFIVDEGIPFLAAAGSKEVAANARGGKSSLASAVGDLGSGAAGLQGLASLIAKPGKASGVGELVQYLPLIQQFMSNQSQQSPSNGGPQAPAGPGHAGGNPGGIQHGKMS